VILAGYKDRMAKFFECNPAFPHASRTTSIFRITAATNDAIADLMLERMGYRSMTGPAQHSSVSAARMEQPHFANARSVRNALDRAGCGTQPSVRSDRRADRETLSTISAQDILASRVLASGSQGRERTMLNQPITLTQY